MTSQLALGLAAIVPHVAAAHGVNLILGLIVAFGLPIGAIVVVWNYIREESKRATPTDAAAPEDAMRVAPPIENALARKSG